MTRPSLIALLMGAAVSGPAWAKPYCPSYEKGKGDGTHKCGVQAFPGKDPTDDAWQAIFAAVALGPARWGDRGPSIANLKSGCGAGQEKTVPAAFPCEILKALAIKESSWHQFCEPTAPSSQKGKPSQTLVSFDCGFGVSQVTSGMHEGESSELDRNRISSDPFYNLAAGANLLASKWQSSRCLEARDPTVLEHWYVALWKYNSYSYSNDPSNPIFSSTRGVWNPAVGGDAPYQEKVFGIVENGSKNGKLWRPVALAYPRVEDVSGRGSTPVAKVECASPMDCTRKRSTHKSQCDLAVAEAFLGGAAARANGGAWATGSPTPATGTPSTNKADGCGCNAATGGWLSLLAAAAATGLFFVVRKRSLKRDNEKAAIGREDVR